MNRNVRNIHCIGKLKHHRTRKEIFYLKSHRAVIPKNNNFEKIKFNKSNQIEKLVNYFINKIIIDSFC
jgi:hypothetical protein